jgi:hypothetical protein
MNSQADVQYKVGVPLLSRPGGRKRSDDAPLPADRDVRL